MGHTDMLNLTPDGGASTQPPIHTPGTRTATRDWVSTRTANFNYNTKRDVRPHFEKMLLCPNVTGRPVACLIRVSDTARAIDTCQGLRLGGSAEDASGSWA
jgi:hypothetical protein